jgi:hypothetical protein
MSRYGLIINEPRAEQQRLWYNDVGAAMPALLNGAFHRETVGRIQTILDDYRK